MFYPIFFGLLLLCQPGTALELSDYLTIVENNNFELSAQSAEIKAVSNEKLINATPEMPMVGFSQETMLMETNYAMVSQQLRFPLKYLYEAQLSEQELDIAKLELESLSLNKKAQAKALYYSLFATLKTQKLIEASQRTLRDYARVAENKYASGKALQNEAMDVHLLITMAESELIEVQTRKEVLESQMNLLAGGELNEFELPLQKNLSIPKTRALTEDLSSWIESTPEYRISSVQEDFSQSQKKLAALEFAPDFQLSYKKSVGGALEDSQMLSVGLSIPLWFWRPGAQLSKASAQLDKARLLKRQKELKLKTQLKALIAEVKSQEKLLTIFKTSLIPQAETSLRIAGANYRSGRGDFGALRSAERATYEVQKQYYAKLESYIQKLVSLEALIGKDIAQW